MDRLTEYHNGIAVIKDKSRMKEAMARLAEYEDLQEQGSLYTVNVKYGDAIYRIVPYKELKRGNGKLRWEIKQSIYQDGDVLFRDVFTSRRSAEAHLAQALMPLQTR